MVYLDAVSRCCIPTSGDGEDNCWDSTTSYSGFGLGWEWELECMWMSQLRIRVRVLVGIHVGGGKVGTE